MLRFFTMLWLLLTLSHAAAQEWRADLSSAGGQIELLVSIFRAHPQMSLERSPYHRSFLEVFELAQKTGLKGDVLQMAPGYTSILTTHASGRMEVDLEAKARFVSRLNKDLARFERLHPEPLTQLIADLTKLRNWPRSVRKSYLRILPLLYDGAGFARSQPLSPGEAELDGLYRDLWSEHLIPILGEVARIKGQGDWLVLARSVEKHFVLGLRESLRPRLVDVEGSREVHTIVLEEMPKPVSLLRGAIGYDCSMHSVPIYSLADKARVFLIRKDPLGSARGYLFMIELSDGRPYIVTVNGSTLSERDVRNAILQIAYLYRTPTLVVGSKNGLFNTEAAAHAAWTNYASKHDVNVELPSQWAQLDKLTEGARSTYENYYSSANLSEAYLVTLTAEDFAHAQRTITLPSRQIYSKPDLKHDAAFDRLKALSVLGEALGVKRAKEFAHELGFSADEARRWFLVASHDDDTMAVRAEQTIWLMDHLAVPAQQLFRALPGATRWVWLSVDGPKLVDQGKLSMSELKEMARPLLKTYLSTFHRSRHDLGPLGMRFLNVVVLRHFKSELSVQLHRDEGFRRLFFDMVDSLDSLPTRPAVTDHSLKLDLFMNIQAKDHIHRYRWELVWEVVAEEVTQFLLRESMAQDLGRPPVAVLIQALRSENERAQIWAKDLLAQVASESIRVEHWADLLGLVDRYPELLRRIALEVPLRPGSYGLAASAMERWLKSGPHTPEDVKLVDKRRGAIPTIQPLRMECAVPLLPGPWL